MYCQKIMAGGLRVSQLLRAPLVSAGSIFNTNLFGVRFTGRRVLALLHLRNYDQSNRANCEYQKHRW